MDLSNLFTESVTTPIPLTTFDDTSIRFNHAFNFNDDFSLNLSTTNVITFYLSSNFPRYDGWLICKQNNILFKIEVINKPSDNFLDLCKKIYNMDWKDAYFD